MTLQRHVDALLNPVNSLNLASSLNYGGGANAGANHADDVGLTVDGHNFKVQPSAMSVQVSRIARPGSAPAPPHHHMAAAAGIDA